MSTPDPITAKPEYLRRTEALITWIEQHDRECDAEETVPLEVINELVAIKEISPAITAAQVEQFMRDQHARLLELCGVKYATVTLTVNGFTGEPCWSTYAGKNTDGITGKSLAEVLAAAAQAMSPDRRATNLREQARALLAEADALTPDLAPE